MKRSNAILGTLAIAALLVSTLPTASILADANESPPPPLPSKPIQPFYADPVPDSETVRLTFSQRWITDNDRDPEPGTVKISFPRAWVTEPPTLAEDDTEIGLRIPYRLLEAHNTSSEPDIITATLPNRYFDGLLAPPIPAKPKRVDSQVGGSSPLAIEYMRRLYYDHTAGDGITGFSGRIVPYSFYNPSGESFLTYQEIEFYGNTSGDAVEIVSAMESAGSSKAVKFAVWRSNSCDFTFGVSVSTGDTVDYEFTTHSASGYTDCWLRVNGGSWNYRNYYDATAATDYTWIDPDSEIDTIGGLSGAIFTDTYPLSIENLETSGSTWHSASYVDQRLDYDHSDPSASYVDVSATLNSSGLFAESWASYWP